MLNKEYVNMLENFGLKERIANKTELTVQGKGKLTIEQIQEAFANKNEKEKEWMHMVLCIRSMQGTPE